MMREAELRLAQVGQSNGFVVSQITKSLSLLILTALVLQLAVLSACDEKLIRFRNGKSYHLSMKHQGDPMGSKVIGEANTRGQVSKVSAKNSNSLKLNGKQDSEYKFPIRLDANPGRIAMERRIFVPREEFLSYNNRRKNRRKRDQFMAQTHSNGSFLVKFDPDTLVVVSSNSRAESQDTRDSMKLPSQHQRAKKLRETGKLRYRLLFGTPFHFITSILCHFFLFSIFERSVYK